MAPEQGDEERYDRRVVVFGLGGVFFDLLAKLRCISIDRLHTPYNRRTIRPLKCAAPP